MSRKHTSVIVILDRSGSMSAMKDDVEGGFDAFVKEQVDVKVDSCDLTLVQFDTLAVETVYTGKPIEEVPPLTLHPRGGTPLLDAIGQTIGEMDDHIQQLADIEQPERVMVIIITDGYENSSTEFSREQVKKLIERHEKEEGWVFVYMGANVDAMAEAGSMGIGALATSGYLPDHAYTAIVSASANLVDYRNDGAYHGFSPEQRKMMVNKADTEEEKEEDQTIT